MAKKKRTAKLPDGVQVIVRNKRALHDYQIHERFEAGMVLTGSEVKSLRAGKAVISDGFVDIRKGEAWLVGVQIKEYAWANRFNHEPQRERKLLLHKGEIRKLAIKTQQRGFTLIPLSLYLKDGKFKIEVALATGKRQYEKRQSAKEASDRREIAQAVKRY